MHLVVAGCAVWPGLVRILAKGFSFQFSVFECEIDPAQWTALRARLIGEINQDTDSLRFYHLGANAARRIEHIGAKPALDLGGTLVF